MRPLVAALAVAFVACGSDALAEEFKSGLQVGEHAGCLQVEWVVGWPYKDQFSGKFAGCMTCTLSPRSPVAIIFTQKVDDDVARLVRALNRRVTGWHSREGPKAFVCAVGSLGHDDLKPLEKDSGDVSLTVFATRLPAWQKNLDKYKLNKDAAVTVIVYGDRGTVTANFAFRETKDLTEEKVKEIGRSLGGNPDNKKVEAPKQVLAVNTQDASVSLVDLATMKELKCHKVGDRPYGIAVSQDGKTVAVGVEDEECVKFFSLPDFKEQGRTKIGKMFNDHIVLTQDGKHVLVANFYSDDVVGIDIETMKEAFRIKDCSAPHVVKYGPLKKYAYVTCKKVTGIAIIDPVGQKLVKFIQTNVNPRSLTFSPDESKVYFGSFWVDGFFELDVESGKVTRLFALKDIKAANPQEVTYHGVEALTDKIVVAANEGRSYVDAVDVTTGDLLGRLHDVSKPCCVERVPGTSPARFLISNIGDATLQLAELTAEGKIKSLGKAQVGKAPKRVAFLP
jgi:DNA-binding beta-propeller fold protein YncE